MQPNTCKFDPAAPIAPELCLDLVPPRTEGAGKAECPMHPRPHVQRQKAHGYWTDPPLTDRWWYPLYEKMVELDVPAMVHVSSCCNPNFHATGSHYINGDTTPSCDS